MFKIIILVLFLLFMYAILKGKKGAVRITILAYFALISIVFMFGLKKISSKYHLYDGPVLDGGFQSLGEWVDVFSYLYIIPSLVVIAYVLFRLVKNLFDRTWVRVVMYIFWSAVIMGMGYVSFFIFTLIFYGFAP